MIASRRTQADEIRAVLTEAIIHGRLESGRLHSARSLAAELNVSRTPVREALIQLARLGLVRFVRNRGVRVVELSNADLAEIFQLRRWLEVPSARIAADKATDADKERLAHEFELMTACARRGDEPGMWRHDRALHRGLMEFTANRKLIDFVDGLRDLVLTRGRTTAARGARSLADTARAHAPILEAIARGDARGAAAAMETHLRETEQLLTGERGLP